MLVLLPPSETKAPGGDGPPLDLTGLSWPELGPLRERLLSALVRLADDPGASRAALGLRPGAGADAEIARNRALRTAPTAAALDRYTGVLYDALDARGLPPEARARAERDVVITSALFGAVRGGDPVPAYRLSAGSRLPGVGPLSAYWRPALAGVLARLAAPAADKAGPVPVLDLRSGAYAALWGPAGTGTELVTVRVLAEAADGSRSVVSHANKAAKGRLARALLELDGTDTTGVGPGRSEAEERLVEAARRSGLRAERTSRGLDLVEPRRPPLRAGGPRAGDRSRAGRS